MAGITHIDRLVFASDFEKPALLLYRIRVVDATGGNRKYNVIVIETFGRTVTMQSVRHKLCVAQAQVGFAPDEGKSFLVQDSVQRAPTGLIAARSHTNGDYRFECF